MKILVIGATGNIGRHVVTGLRERGHTVRTLSRSTGEGDLTRPETLRGPLSDVDSVFLLWPFMNADGAQEVVDLVAEHARRVVYVSAMNVADDDSGVWGQVEAAIRRTGLAWTFLRPGGFATNTLEWADAIRAGQPVRMPSPKAARSLIHERDIADVAVLALTEDGHTGKTYALTGPEAITQAEQVRILGEVVGKPATVEEMTPEQAREAVSAWADESYAEAALAYWASLVDNPEPVTSTVEEVTGHPARTFTQWARDHIEDYRDPSAA
jgi:uncharacterized protein YbjT (DUF2867 family)